MWNLINMILISGALIILICQPVFSGNVNLNQNISLQNVPTVMIAVLARNKAHTLPYFLTLLERLEYPKNRLSLW